ncbi:zinc finger protein ZXDC [Lampris incognitus]|uniref:zinc finger protein ZXDC n=1 Tax=Lampris incognitus TaxID=2546036 RepID=UPI0024B59084|nr:zinc finger protein ZXDC [Lampris incognitus]
MEIQGLSDAQNIHSQHGALRGTGSSSLSATTETPSYAICRDNDAGGFVELHGPQSDKGDGPIGASPFCPLVANGSGTRRRICKHEEDDEHDPEPGDVGFGNVKAPSLQLEFSKPAFRRDRRSGDTILQMALPPSEGGEQRSQQRRLLSPVLRQHREDGASQQQQQKPSSLAAERNAADRGSSNNTGRANTNTEDFYVVFNVVQKDGSGETSKHRADALSESGDKMRGERKDGCKISPRGGSMEVENADILVVSSDENLDCLEAKKDLRKSDDVCNFLGEESAEGGEAAVTENAKQTVEGVVLPNEHGDGSRVQVCTVGKDRLTGELSLQPRDNNNVNNNNNYNDDGCTLVAENACIVKAVNMGDAMDTSDLISDAVGLQQNTNADMATASAAASETFSGTIMINNQSIIVTIENGILTLAAPPEGYVHKDDDMISLKEHLGMKDHEDIVLLNYDSGTKSIGKISTLGVSGSGQHEDPRPSLSVSDSDLTLVDDCSLSELGTSLDPCPIVKQETGTLCAITEGDLVAHSPKATVASCDDSDLQSVHLVKSKKETMESFGCPELGCSCAFATRQKLKIHLLLNHAEDPRPYQCTVEGCGWAFATSYKLKRHLQSHDKQRPHTCQFEGCGRRFTTIYNLKAHVKVHDQENAFVCEICNKRFRSATRLTNHQRVHFEPQRPYKCEFPGCEKTFITFSALFSHNRTHFRETGHFTCTYPGCDKTYDKACRLKIHMRSHTGERPFVCDSEGCGWSFTCMSKLLRHKRKHDDDRRFTCPEEGCGKSFTRAEHLKGHSITHLGTKPFQCHAEGCNAKFSARSSLYIHSKKHKQDASTLKTRCPMANCSKHFSSRSSLKSHMFKHHHLSADVLNQMETTPTLTPSSELISSTPATVAGPAMTGTDQLTNLDLSSLFSSVPGGSASTPGIGMGGPIGGSSTPGTFTMDLSLVSSGILTIDPSSVGTTLGTSTSANLAKALDPLILATSSDIGPHHGLEGTVGDVLPPQGTLNLDDVQTVTPEALGNLSALTMQGAGASVDHALSHPLSSEPTASLAVAPVAELLSSPSKVVEVGGQGGAGPLLGCVEVLGPQEGGKVLTQFVFPGHSSFSPQKDTELNAVSPSSFLDSGGSARTDYRAIQLAKKKKQRGPALCSGSSGSGQRKGKGGKAASISTSLAPSGARYSEGVTTVNGGLTLRDPVTGAQYVQIQLLQDDPASDGDLPFQLSSQPSSSHSQLTVDLPVNILQEPSAMTEDDSGSDNSQFTGSTINLQDLE